MADASVMVATDTTCIAGEGNCAELNGYTAAKVTAGIDMYRTFNSPEVDILSSRNGSRRVGVPRFNYKRLGKVAAAGPSPLPPFTLSASRSSPHRASRAR